MILEPAGLFARERHEALTPALYDELVARDEAFTLTIDYRGLEPPVEELDRVRLVPATAADLPAGALALWRAGEGFVLRRVGRRPDTAAPGRRVARVVRVERPGRTHDLDSSRWRLAGALLVGSPVFRAAHSAVSALFRIAAKLAHPLPCPLSLGRPDHLVEGVIAKYANPADVVHQTRLARGGLEAWETSLFSRIVPPRGRALVVGCGAGREVVPLAKAGHRVVGTDPVRALIDAARQFAKDEGVDVELRVAAAHALDFPRGSFDAVLCSQAVYEQTPTRRRRLDLLRSLAAILAPGGVLVLGVGWNPTRGPRLALVDALRAALRRLLGERFTTEPGDRLIRFVSLASDAWQPCFYHVFRGPEEIAAEIAAAGLTGTRAPEGAWLVRPGT